MTESAIEKQEEKHNILKYLYEMEDNQNYNGTLLGALNATTYYDSHRDEIYFKKTVITDEAFFRQLDGKQLSDKLLKYVEQYKIYFRHSFYCNYNCFVV